MCGFYLKISVEIHVFREYHNIVRMAHLIKQRDKIAAEKAKNACFPLLI